MTIRSKLAALLRHDIARYFVASLVALAADVATLSASLRLLHLELAWSASLGFIVGAAVAYLLSIRWVFRQRAFGDAPTLEFLTFVGIGVAGLTFAFNYVVRKSLLFASQRRARNARERAA